MPLYPTPWRFNSLMCASEIMIRKLSSGRQETTQTAMFQSPKQCLPSAVSSCLSYVLSTLCVTSYPNLYCQWVTFVVTMGCKTSKGGGGACVCQWFTTLYWQLYSYWQCLPCQVGWWWETRWRSNPLVLPNISWHLWCYCSNSCSHYMSEHIYNDHLPSRPIHGTLDNTLQEKVVQHEIWQPKRPCDQASPSAYLNMLGRTELSGAGRGKSTNSSTGWTTTLPK